MIPGRSFRYTLRTGVRGHDVWALQLNLNEAGFGLAVDGVFGAITEQAVRDYQRWRTIAADGVAGPTTQRYLALELLRPSQRDHRIPLGLMRGVTEGESGWFVGAVNWGVAGGVDCGWTQRRVLERDFSDEAFRAAFSGRTSFSRLAVSLREDKDRFHGRPGAPTDARAWELATLAHNWPAGAEVLARGGALSDEPAEWVQRIGVPDVETPAEWAEHYILRAAAYVSRWTP